MSHAASERDGLHKILKASYAQIHAAGKAYASAYQQAAACTDLVEAMGSMVEAIIAAEQLQKAASEAVKAARASLGAAMSDTGATQIATSHHLAYLARKPAVLVIDDSKAIPPEYLIQPPPIPDRKRIHDAIDAGQSVAGCSMIIPNEMSLGIRSRSSK